MKLTLKKYFKEIGYGMVVILFLIAVILAFIYSWLLNTNFVIGFLAMILAVFGAYYIFLSFERAEEPLKLGPGEQRNLQTPAVGVVIFPKNLGGVRSKDMFRNLSIYLTNKRIIARNAWNEYFLDLPLTSIYGFKLEKVIATNYIRIRFLEKGKQEDALLFVGNEEGFGLWMERLRKLGVKELSEKQQEEESFLEDSEKIKEEI